MPSFVKRAKRLISTFLVTLLVVTSTLTTFPSSARAEGNLVEGNIEINVMKCEKDCGNMWTFAVGAVTGSAVTLMATGDTATLAAVAATVGHTAVATVAPLAALAPTFAPAAPVLVPVAATAAVGYGAYQLWQVVTHDQTTESGR